MRPIAISRLFLACGAVFLAASGMVRADDPVEKTPHLTPPPKVVIEKRIATRNPQAFARQLSDLVGVEVRLPVKGFPLLTVPAGEWTAVQVLDLVAKQMKETDWQLVFQLKKRGTVLPLAAKPTSKLPPPNRVTIQATDVSFPRAIRLIQDAAACVIELPDNVPQGRFWLSWQDVPLETALKELGKAASLEVVPVIRFERADEMEAKRA